MGCNASVEDGEENPQSSALGKSEKGELSLQRICFYQLQLQTNFERYKPADELT